MEQITDSIRVPNIKLEEKTLKKLDEIFPGPGGEAPRAYALVEPKKTPSREVTVSSNQCQSPLT